jgi:tRNA(Ile)-lysidine synthase
LTPAIADVRRAVRDGFEAAGLVAGDLVLVACSGGADSLALAAAAAFEAPRYGHALPGENGGLRLGAVVIDHGMQAGSAEVAGATAQKLLKLGLDPVEIRSVAVGTEGGPEAAARTARYEAIDQVAEETGANAILLGHTLNDQAETVLMGLARGSGAKSLNGMAVVSGNYVRPLLGIKRETTEAFCTDSGLEPWQDPMNKDESYTRVRVRKNLLPALEAELGPGIAEALARTADTLREDDDVLAELALAAYKEVAKEGATQISIGVQEFKDLPIAIRHRVIALAAVVLQAPMLARVHILAIDELVDSWHGQKPLTLPGIRVERTGETIALKTTKTLKTGAC